MRLQLIERVRRIAAHASGLAGNRLALFSLEVEEEFERQLGHFVLLLITVGFAAFSMLFASIFVLVLGWQAGYLASTAVGLSLFHAALACAVGWKLKQNRDLAPRPFDATLSEFEQDVQALRKPQEELP